MSRLPPSPPAAGAQRDQAPRPPSLRRHPYRYSTEFPVLTDRIAVDGTQWCEEISDDRCRLHVHLTINVQLRGLGPQVSPVPRPHPPAPALPSRRRRRHRRRVDETAGAAQIEKQIEKQKPKPKPKPKPNPNPNPNPNQIEKQIDKGVRSAYAELPERACDYLLHQGDTARMDASATPATSLLGDDDSQAPPPLLASSPWPAPLHLLPMARASSCARPLRHHTLVRCGASIAHGSAHPPPPAPTPPLPPLHFHPTTRPPRRRHPPPRLWGRAWAWARRRTTRRRRP